MFEVIGTDLFIGELSVPLHAIGMFGMSVAFTVIAFTVVYLVGWKLLIK